MKVFWQAVIAAILFIIGTTAGLYLFTEAEIEHPQLTNLAVSSWIVQMTGLIWLIVLIIKGILKK